MSKPNNETNPRPFFEMNYSQPVKQKPVRRATKTAPGIVTIILFYHPIISITKLLLLQAPFFSRVFMVVFLSLWLFSSYENFILFHSTPFSPSLFLFHRCQTILPHLLFLVIVSIIVYGEFAVSVK
jgi:hypothetical protein